MTRKYKIKIFFIYFVYLCSFMINLNGYERPKYVDLAHELNAEVINKFSKAHNLLAVGTDAGLAGEVYLLGARFQTVGPKTIEELRALLVECIELYKTTINNCPEIRPHLRNNSFDERNISLAIFLKDKKGNLLQHPEIGVVSATGGHISYMTEESDSTPYKSLLEETYEDAYNLVKKQQAEKSSKP